jgi:hypothetical protein
MSFDEVIIKIKKLHIQGATTIAKAGVTANLF